MRQESNPIFEARLRNCAETLPILLRRSIAEGHPADRVASDAFRANKKLGSSDRRLMSDTFYSFLRSWGFIKKGIQDFAGAISDSTKPLPGRRAAYEAMFFSALLDRGAAPEILDILRGKLDISAENMKKILRIQTREEIASAAIFAICGKNIPFDRKDSAPDWIAAEVPDGRMLERLLPILWERPPIWIRAQTENIQSLLDDLGKHEIKGVPSNAVPGAISLGKPRLNVYTMDSFRSGLFEIQDIASQCIGLACGANPGEKWWDACAGAGGKSLQLSFLMKNKGSVYATDIREYKLEDLKKRAKRAERSNIRTAFWDGGSQPSRYWEKYDGVLVDAPCSCSGTWRRNPDAKWTSNSAEISELQSLQGRLLENASKSVRKGGTLVYATCSIFNRENRGVVSSFLEKNPDFVLEPFANPFGGTSCDACLDIYSWDSDCDCVFVAKMKKKAETFVSAL